VLLEGLGKLEKINSPHRVPNPQPSGLQLTTEANICTFMFSLSQKICLKLSESRLCKNKDDTNYRCCSTKQLIQWS
jgi:hypothetical protein